MVHAARALDLRVMLGCMIESELGIALSAQLAPLVDYVDLDGHLLIEPSDWRGLGFADGRIVLSPEPGLGVTPGGRGVSLALFTDDLFHDGHAKTAHGILRFGTRDVVAVVDTRHAGGVASDVVPYARAARADRGDGRRGEGARRDDAA